MKKQFKNLLLLPQFSWIYSIYLFLFRNRIYQSKKIEFNFYKSLPFHNTNLAFDIGANIGDKSELLCNIFRKVVAIEPDKRNVKLLEKRFWLRRKLFVEDCAVGLKEGSEVFYVHWQGSPANTLSNKWKKILEDPSKNRWSRKLDFQESYQVKVKTLDYLVNKYGVPDYVKIDVEGYELEVLNGLSSPLAILSMEANFPEFKNETIDCVRYLLNLSNSYLFNIINDEHSFIFEEKMNGEKFITWLEKTEMNYFEFFCFNN